MSTRSPVAGTAAPVAHRPASPTGTLRLGTALVLGGAVAEYGVTTLHPASEAPDHHSAVFAEYAASDAWIAVHLGQFAAGLVLLAGVLVLLRGLRAAGAAALLVRVGEAAAIVTGAVFAVLQAVDGVALKQAVDSLAAAPGELRAAAFHDAEIVRWTEWAMAGYFRVTLGSDGFAGGTLPNLTSWSLLATFAVAAAAAAWRRRSAV